MNSIKNFTLLAIAIFTTQLAIAQLPDPGFVIDNTTAIVITDPQNDFLSPDGVTWGLVGESVKKNNRQLKILKPYLNWQKRTESPFLFLHTIITNMTISGNLREH